MIRWLKSLFAWRLVREAAVWHYYENGVTGRRSAHRIVTGGHSPLDWDWLLSGKDCPLVNGLPAWRSAYRNTLPDGWYWA